jgi:hypothetical protein
MHVHIAIRCMSAYVLYSIQYVCAYSRDMEIHPYVVIYLEL